MFISGNSTPKFKIINDFRSKILRDATKALFTEVLKMLVEMGCLSLDVQYIDGTKIETKSNNNTIDWRSSVEKYKEKLEVKIKRVMPDIETSIFVLTPIPFYYKFDAKTFFSFKR